MGASSGKEASRTAGSREERRTDSKHVFPPEWPAKETERSLEGSVSLGVAIFGDSGVGKTTLFNVGTTGPIAYHVNHGRVVAAISYVSMTLDGGVSQRKKNDSPYRTIAVKEVLSDQPMKEQLQAAFSIAVVMFDVTRRDTFLNLKKHYLDHLFRGERCLHGCAYVLVGNKGDLEQEREVSVKEAQAFSRIHSIPYVEICACDPTSVVRLWPIILASMKHCMLGAHGIKRQLWEQAPGQ
mmetsp:Transcript_12441/g.31550  ORF Transcript_12441/g.31550 Transcript_12441/m.31550 type:complete len:239 (-) Transcript_12441:96-812(-)